MAFPAQSPVALRPGARPEPRRSPANCYSCRSRQGLFLLVGAGAGFERLAPWPLTCYSRCLLAAVVSLVAGAACKGWSTRCGRRLSYGFVLKGAAAFRRLGGGE